MVCSIKMYLTGLALVSHWIDLQPHRGAGLADRVAGVLGIIAVEFLVKPTNLKAYKFIY